MEKENIFIERFTPLYKKERLVVFYKNQMFADCIFKVSGVEIKAHKLIMACSSPVFEKMFFGDMASNEVIICDINVDEFNQVLEFIYSENITISCMLNAWSLFYIANKYLLDDLINVCLEYIQKNITMSTLVLSYEYSEMYNLHDIKKQCFSDIINYVSGAFTSDYHMKPTTLSAILDQNDGLRLDKYDLCIEILKWAAVECDFRKMSAIPKNIVNILRTEAIIKYIRKDWLTILKCIDCDDSLVMCCCTDEIIHQTLLLLDEVLTWSEKLCDTKTMYKSTPNICRLRKEFKIACRIDLQNTEEYVSSVSVNRKMMIFGILINTEMNQPKPTSLMDNFYKGSVTVRVCEQNSIASIAKPTTIKGFFCYNSDLYLSFKDLVTLEPSMLYDIRISYKNHCNIDVTSVHCYYMSSKLMNESKDSIVSFYEMSGTLIKGLAFYAA